MIWCMRWWYDMMHAIMIWCMRWLYDLMHAMIIWCMRWWYGMMHAMMIWYDMMHAMIIWCMRWWYDTRWSFSTETFPWRTTTIVLKFHKTFFKAAYYPCTNIFAHWVCIQMPNTTKISFKGFPWLSNLFKCSEDPLETWQFRIFGTCFECPSVQKAGDKCNSRGAEMLKSQLQYAHSKIYA